MNRRDFLNSLLAIATTGVVDPEALLWKLTRSRIFVPSKAQIDFMERSVPMKLWGIPYHECDASIGQWLGINRIVGIHEEVLQLIKVLEESKHE